MVDRVNTTRLAANAIEAAEQSDRLTVPAIREPVTLDRLLAQWPHDRPLILCDPTGAGGRVPGIAAALMAAGQPVRARPGFVIRSDEQTSELPSLMRTPSALF